MLAAAYSEAVAIFSLPRQRGWSTWSWWLNDEKGGSVRRGEDEVEELCTPGESPQHRNSELKSSDSRVHAPLLHQQSLFHTWMSFLQRLCRHVYRLKSSRKQLADSLNRFSCSVKWGDWCRCHIEELNMELEQAANLCWLPGNLEVTSQLQEVHLIKKQLQPILHIYVKKNI